MIQVFILHIQATHLCYKCQAVNRVKTRPDQIQFRTLPLPLYPPTPLKKNKRQKN
jgi:hypothetical protein